MDLSGSAFSCARVFSITSETKKLNIKYLLAILNSKLIEFYLHKTASLKQGGYYSYSSAVIDALPLALNFENQETVIKKVDEIIEAKKQNPNADTSKLECQIDKLVYQLYGLTDEEIRIVEGKDN